MRQKLVVGPISKGLRNDVTPFNVDNDAFPVLVNAYQWRKRIKRKRGTTLLGRLIRDVFNTTATSINLVNPSPNTFNLFQLLGLNTSEQYASIRPGDASYIISISVGGQTLTDSAGTGTMTVTAGNITAATLNYANGDLTITFAAPAAGQPVIVTLLKYYPNLPVMGLEPFVLDSSDFPIELGFDTEYAYNISLSNPYPIHSVSYYLNPVTATYPGYNQKTAPWTSVRWNLQDYQQMWSTNYQNALWAIPGISSPFTTTNIGMPFKLITGFVIDSAPAPALATLTIVAHGLTRGDFLFLNEIGGITGANLQTCYVVSADPQAANTVQVEFPAGTLGGAYTSGGIAQYLTRSPDTSKDCIRWYNGEPVTSGNVFVTNAGWVNFCPPLTTSNFAGFSISDLSPGQYYLVGARMAVPYKDRLLFFGPVVQTSTGSPVYLQDTVIYSQNGTPYYTASFANVSVNPTISDLINTVFTPVLVPTNQTAQPQAFFENATGFGGFISAGYARPITSVSPNEDALIVGFADRQARLLYTGNDSIPFNFYIINSELGSDATFSTITLDRGVLSVGGRGFIITSQISSQRIDLEILKEVFEIKLTDSGARRICAQRDFINEWVYFTYPSSSFEWKFPTRTLQYNYREETWGMFNETYTTYGTVRFQTGYTWSTIPDSITWETWNDPWNAGDLSLLQPQVLAGNQQGFILIREQDTTDEGNSLTIKNVSIGSQSSVAITGATTANPCVLTANNTFSVGQTVTVSGVQGMTQLNGNTYYILAVTPTTVTIDVDSSTFTPYITGGTLTATKTIFSPNHCLNMGDYIIISGCLGTVASQLNDKIFQVTNANTLSFNISLTETLTGTYLGGGVIKRMYIPYIQTKQFPVSWEYGKKTRLGDQLYLFSKTDSGNITLLIFLSQNASNPYNDGPVVPYPNSDNNALIYSTELQTSPELYKNQANNASLGTIGNGVTLTFTFLYGSIFGLNGGLVPGTVVVTVGSIATFTDQGDGTFVATGTGASGTIDYAAQEVTIVFSVAPTAQATTTTFQYYYPDIQNPTAVQQEQIWHRVSTSLIGDTVQIGITMNDEQMQDPDLNNQFSEIELHSIILDVYPSSDLA